MLTTSGVERGLIGPREVPRIWTRHVLNCALVEALIPPSAQIADVGSGAGLPGVVLALVRPDLRVTLVEPLLRRAVFLEEVLADLEISDRVRIARVRGEDYRGPPFPVVTARAVAPLHRLVGTVRPLVAPGGTLLAVKGRRASDELAESADALSSAGVVGQIRTLGDPALVPEPTTVVVLRFGG